MFLIATLVNWGASRFGSKTIRTLVIVYLFGRLGTFIFFSKSSDFEIFWANVAILESTNPKKNSRTLDAF